MPYSSSLSDAEWSIFEPMLPKKKQTRPPKWSKREIFDGILYQLKSGRSWGKSPQDLPPYSTLYWHYKQWRADGVLDQLMVNLHAQVRAQAKKPNWTTLILIDSQAVKNTCNASVASKGFCHYKATNGIKRHLAVEYVGMSLFDSLHPSQCHR